MKFLKVYLAIIKLTVAPIEEANATINSASKKLNNEPIRIEIPDATGKDNDATIK